MKKCRPGMICVENVTLVVLLICIGIFGYYYVSNGTREQPTKIIYQPTPQQINYQPPIQYRQVGILTPLNGKETNNILPLMGRHIRRGQWNYYTISNQHNNVKLPISLRGKSALGERGVDEISNGDSVFVEGVFDAYKATVYDNDTLRYMP